MKGRDFEIEGGAWLKITEMKHRMPYHPRFMKLGFDLSGTV